VRAAKGSSSNLDPRGAWKSGAFGTGRGMTRHPKLGAVERRLALLLNFLTCRTSYKISGALERSRALSRRTQMTRPNGVSTLYAYDPLSRLTSVLHQLSGSTIDGATYTVDNAGNRIAKTDQRTAVTSNYSYDPIYELTQVLQGTNTTESYSYDPVGNRLSSLGVSPYNYNVSNELTSTPNATYTYDANGNTLTKVDSTGTTSYTWDFENRLTSVTLPGSGGTVSYRYDPFGRRIYKSSSGGTSVYAYDGDNLIEETNSSGAAVARYSQGLNIDEPLAMLRSSATSYYHVDGLNSVTSLSNAAGSLAQTYTFDSFGKTTNSTGSLTNPFQYTAREFDTETGLYFYRAKYYDSTAGRFLNEDPIRFGGGANFYRYVFNNPARLTDSNGLSSRDVQRIMEACKKCTKAMSDQGRRLPGSGVPMGWLNDFTYWFSKKRESCYGQAQLAQPCLENPSTPYDDKWSFHIVTIWLGTHRIVEGYSSNLSDPVVVCDPWLNETYTYPSLGQTLLPNNNQE
jgi:RHS repeat-associated protein